jgi:hypothetical protein
MTLSEVTKGNYESAWKYLKQFVTDITNFEQTIKEIESIRTTKRNKPVNIGSKRNYILTIMYMIGNDNYELKAKYSNYVRPITTEINSYCSKQLCSESMKGKLSNLTWPQIVAFKDEIVKSPKVKYENKLLVRLYTELECPVRNDFVNLRVFIDEPRPANFNGNCLMLTRKPIQYKKRKLRVIKKSEPTPDADVCDEAAVIYPVRNILWLSDFKTASSNPDIIQSIPDKLANDIIEHCTKKQLRIMFPITDSAMSFKIRFLFNLVSGRKIGINVLRHVFIMNKMNGAPMLDVRKQLARKMGHGIGTQELYRVHIDS